MKAIMQLIFLLIMSGILLLTISPYALAKGGGGGPDGHGFGGFGGGPGGHGEGFGGPGFGFHEGKKVGWHGKGVPPGWHHGRKRGWHGRDEPPGLFKKGF